MTESKKTFNNVVNKIKNEEKEKRKEIERKWRESLIRFFSHFLYRFLLIIRIILPALVIYLVFGFVRCLICFLAFTPTLVPVENEYITVDGTKYQIFKQEYREDIGIIESLLKEVSLKTSLKKPLKKDFFYKDRIYVPARIFSETLKVDEITRHQTLLSVIFVSFLDRDLFFQNKMLYVEYNEFLKLNCYEKVSENEFKVNRNVYFEILSLIFPISVILTLCICFFYIFLGFIFEIISELKIRYIPQIKWFIQYGTTDIEEIKKTKEEENIIEKLKVEPEKALNYRKIMMFFREEEDSMEFENAEIIQYIQFDKKDVKSIYKRKTLVGFWDKENGFAKGYVIGTKETPFGANYIIMKEDVSIFSFPMELIEPETLRIYGEMPDYKTIEVYYKDLITKWDSLNINQKRLFGKRYGD